MTEPPFRVGLVGFGLAGSTFHAPFIAAIPEFRLDAVVTRNEERAAAVRAGYPQATVVASSDELLERQPDLVVVASANDSHAPIARAALATGARVVIDKPMATNSADAEDLVKLATPGQLTVFQNRRYDGDFRTVRLLLEDGTLGTVHRFESRFERWRPQLSGNWRESGNPALAGGLLFDLGSHLVDQALALFGPVAQVYAEVDFVRPGAAADDDAFVALQHTSGVHSHLWMSAVAADLGPRFRVLGDRGGYVKYGLDPQEASLRDGARPTDPGFGEEPEADWGRLVAGDASRPVPTLPGDYLAFYRAVANALVGDGDMPVNPEGALAALRVIEAARLSGQEQRVVVLN